MLGNGNQGTAELTQELSYATVTTALATVIAAAAERWFGLEDMSSIFITAVLFVAVRTRMSVAVYAATLCFMSYNFFFIPPRFTFYIAAGPGVVTVTSFLIVALICGRLANRLRNQVSMLRAANAHTAALQGLGQRLGAAANEAEVYAAALVVLRQVLNADVVVLVVDESLQRLSEVASEGAWVITADGRRLLDCGGYGAFLHGHRHPRVVAALRDPLDRHPLATRALLEPDTAAAAAALR